MRNLALPAVAFGALGLILTTGVVGALSVDSSTERLVLVREAVTTDRSVLLTLRGNELAPDSRAENALSCPGREATASNPVIRNDQVQGDLLYTALVQESQPDAWPAGRIYEVEVFDEGNLIATLYFRNATAEDVVEGVRFRVDVGQQSSAPRSYSTIVTRLNACP